MTWRCVVFSWKIKRMKQKRKLGGMKYSYADSSWIRPIFRQLAKFQVRQRSARRGITRQMKCERKNEKKNGREIHSAIKEYNLIHHIICTVCGSPWVGMNNSFSLEQSLKRVFNWKFKNKTAREHSSCSFMSRKITFLPFSTPGRRGASRPRPRIPGNRGR